MVAYALNAGNWSISPSISRLRLNKFTVILPSKSMSPNARELGEHGLFAQHCIHTSNGPLGLHTRFRMNIGTKPSLISVKAIGPWHRSWNHRKPRMIGHGLAVLRDISRDESVHPKLNGPDVHGHVAPPIWRGSRTH